MSEPFFELKNCKVCKFENCVDLKINKCLKCSYIYGHVIERYDEKYRVRYTILYCGDCKKYSRSGCSRCETKMNCKNCYRGKIRTYEDEYSGNDEYNESDKCEESDESEECEESEERSDCGNH